MELIQDARVLQAEFIPREVQYRDGEVDALSSTLQPLIDGDPPETSFLYGPSGAGKTCIAQFTLERLREQVLDIEYQYVNCWQHYTRFRTLYRLLEGINETLDIHRQSTPKDELLARLQAYDGPPYVVILDEVDQLEDPEVLYDLYTLSNVSMVLIANREEELFARLEPRVQSRLQSCRRIHFESYSTDELVEILDARVRWGLREDAIDTDDLAHIADAAAGDARVAIGILRNAARDAQRAGAERIDSEHIHDAVEETRQEVTRTNLEKLKDHQRVLYEIVAEHSEISPGDLYAAYEQQVEDPKTKRTMRTYLEKMERYNLITAEGERRGRRYAVAHDAGDSAGQ